MSGMDDVMRLLDEDGKLLAVVTENEFGSLSLRLENWPVMDIGDTIRKMLR